jgi:hypothetical protein
VWLHRPVIGCCLPLLTVGEIKLELDSQGGKSELSILYIFPVAPKLNMKYSDATFILVSSVMDPAILRNHFKKGWLEDDVPFYDDAQLKVWRFDILISYSCFVVAAGRTHRQKRTERH